MSDVGDVERKLTPKDVRPAVRSAAKAIYDALGSGQIAARAAERINQRYESAPRVAPLPKTPEEVEMEKKVDEQLAALIRKREEGKL